LAGITQAALQQGPSCSSPLRSQRPVKPAWDHSTSHSDLTQSFSPLQLLSLAKRLNIMLYARALVSTARPRDCDSAQFQSSTSNGSFSLAVSSHAHSNPQLHDYPQEMLPQPLSQPSSLSKLPQGAKPNPNHLFLLPVAADQAPFPGTASPCLCKPSPAARLVAKHLLHRQRRQSRLLPQAQLSASARAAAAQQGKRHYFNKKLSKVPPLLPSLGRTPTRSQEQGLPCNPSGA